MIWGYPYDSGNLHWFVGTSWLLWSHTFWLLSSTTSPKMYKQRLLNFAVKDPSLVGWNHRLHVSSGEELAAVVSVAMPNKNPTVKELPGEYREGEFLKKGLASVWPCEIRGTLYDTIWYYIDYIWLYYTIWYYMMLYDAMVNLHHEQAIQFLVSLLEKVGFSQVSRERWF